MYESCPHLVDILCVFTHHFDDLWVGLFCEVSSADCDIIDELVEGLSACILSSSGLTVCPWNQTQHNTAEVSSRTTPAAPEQRRLCTDKEVKQK